MWTPWLSTTTSVVIIAIATVTMTSCQAHDNTVTPGAKGSAVVEATLDRLSMQCVFVDDKLLMRRIAYVESEDGNSSVTFKRGYYGGIWQVDQLMFSTTQSLPAIGAMSKFISKIRTSLDIDWSKVVWKDLLKPLYSALGALIYIKYMSLNDVNGIPRDIPAQAEFWKRYYRSNGNFENYVHAAQWLENGCRNNLGADIVFVLDGSRNVRKTEFASIKKFVKDFISSFVVAADRNRFGVIVYSSEVEREFDLKDYSSMEDTLRAVDKIEYEGERSNMHLALEEMRTKSFTEKNGARSIAEGHPRVGIILTAGPSNNRRLTIGAALKVQDADITAFAIGVGSTVVSEELDAIASNPDCFHRFCLKNFSEIDALKNTIVRRTCEAPIIFSPSPKSMNSRLPPGSEQKCKIKVSKEGATVKMLATSGSATFYISKSAYPSSEYYDHKVAFAPKSPGIIFVPEPEAGNGEGLVFCNIKGDNVAKTNISVSVDVGDTNPCKSSPCLNGGVCTHSIEDYQCKCKEGWEGKNCGSEKDSSVSLKSSAIVTWISGLAVLLVVEKTHLFSIV